MVANLMLSIQCYVCGWKFRTVIGSQQYYSYTCSACEPSILRSKTLPQSTSGVR